MGKDAKTTHISLTEAKQRLGELVKRSAYGGERFVLEFRGKPVAELRALEQDMDERRLVAEIRETATSYETDKERRERGLKALEELSEFREALKAKYGMFPDSAELIREMREERDNQILGLR